MKPEREERQISEVAASAEPASEPQVRAPYRRPILRHLGSVRDLALGSPQGAILDAKGFLKH